MNLKLRNGKAPENPKFIFIDRSGRYFADIPGCMERFAKVADAASKVDLKSGPTIRAMGKGFREWALKAVEGEFLEIGPLNIIIGRTAEINEPIKLLLPQQPPGVVDEAKPSRGLIVEP